jgi:hypothetical protein
MKRMLMTLVTTTLLFVCVCFLSSAPVMAQGNTKPDAMAAEYEKMGGSKGELGTPSGETQSGPHGGRWRPYQHGAIYWSAKTGAHAVSGAAFEKYKEAGAAAGALGYPVRDAFDLKTGGKEIVFQHGFVVLNEAGEAVMTATPWATFTEVDVTFAPGVKAQTLLANTALLLPPSGGSGVTVTCNCAPSQSIESGRCSVTITGKNTISCKAGTCRFGCVITIQSADNK